MSIIEAARRAILSTYTVLVADPSAESSYPPCCVRAPQGAGSQLANASAPLIDRCSERLPAGLAAMSQGGTTDTMERAKPTSQKNLSQVRLDVPSSGRRSWRIGPESIGARGLSALAATAALATALAITGYQNHSLASLSATLSSGAAVAPSSASTSSSAPSGTGSSTSSSAPSTASTTSTTGPLLSSTQYASFAYQVYPGPVSASAQAALAGFQVSTKQAGSNIVLTLSVAGGGQSPTTKSYPATDHVYFIEANFGDDSAGTEYNLGDDGLIATNASGHIVQ